MKTLGLAAFMVLVLAAFSFAQNAVLIDDFEGTISGGPEGTVDFGAGNGSALNVQAATDIKKSGAQSLKISYDSVPGGYMYIARGEGLDAKNSAWLLKSKDIDWTKYDAISFYVYGNKSGADIAFDIKDAGNELWRFMFIDDVSGWKQVVCEFSGFSARTDWQPDAADKNSVLNFPVKSFQFEPKSPGKNVIYIDKAEVMKK